MWIVRQIVVLMLATAFMLYPDCIPASFASAAESMPSTATAASTAPIQNYSMQPGAVRVSFGVHATGQRTDRSQERPGDIGDPSSCYLHCGSLCVAIASPFITIEELSLLAGYTAQTPAAIDDYGRAPIPHPPKSIV